MAWKSVMKELCSGNFWKLKRQGPLVRENTHTGTHAHTHHAHVKPSNLDITQGRREPRGFLTPGSTLPGSSLPLAPSSTRPRLLAVHGYTCSPLREAVYCPPSFSLEGFIKLGTYGIAHEPEFYPSKTHTHTDTHT